MDLVLKLSYLNSQQNSSMETNQLLPSGCISNKTLLIFNSYQYLYFVVLIKYVLIVIMQSRVKYFLTLRAL